MIKRPAPHDHVKQGDVYICRNTSFPVLLKRIETLLFVTGLKQVTLYGMGACITKTTQLALSIQEKHKTIQFSIQTSTLPVIDDISSNVSVFSFILYFRYSN